jgi:hypothetical protein
MVATTVRSRGHFLARLRRLDFFPSFFCDAWLARRFASFRSIAGRLRRFTSDANRAAFVGSTNFAGGSG